MTSRLAIAEPMPPVDAVTRARFVFGLMFISTPSHRVDVQTQFTLVELPRIAQMGWIFSSSGGHKARSRAFCQHLPFVTRGKSL
jgi:hypothetical protein